MAVKLQECTQTTWWKVGLSATQQTKETETYFSTSATQHASCSSFGMVVHIMGSTSRPLASIAFHGLVIRRLTCKGETLVNRFPCLWLRNTAKVTSHNKAVHVNICGLVAWRLTSRCDKPVGQFQNRWPSAWLRRSSCSLPPL